MTSRSSTSCRRSRACFSPRRSDPIRSGRRLRERPLSASAPWSHPTRACPSPSARYTAASRLAIPRATFPQRFRKPAGWASASAKPACPRSRISPRPRTIPFPESSRPSRRGLISGSTPWWIPPPRRATSTCARCGVGACRFTLACRPTISTASRRSTVCSCSNSWISTPATFLRALAMSRSWSCSTSSPGSAKPR